MSKQEKIFCTVLIDFLKDMNSSYPDPSLFILIKATETMIMASPSRVIENFMLCVDPYVDKIKNKDESFFLDGGLSKSLDGEYSFLSDEINKVIKIWNNTNTTKKTKDVIWKYFHVLTQLGLKIRK